MSEELYEHRVFSWLAQKAHETEILGLKLQLHAGEHREHRCVALAPQGGCWIAGMGASLAEAVESVRNRLETPQERAAAARREANRLIAFATETEIEMEAARISELRTEGKKHELKPAFHD